MEGLQLGLEAVVSSIFDGSADYVKTDQETKFQIHRIFEGFTYLLLYVRFIVGSTMLLLSSAWQPGLLQQLLSLKWTQLSLVVIHGHYLDSLGPFLRHYPKAVASIVNKLFELLTSLPITIQVHFLCCSKIPMH